MGKVKLGRRENFMEGPFRVYGPFKGTCVTPHVTPTHEELHGCIVRSTSIQGSDMCTHFASPPSIMQK